VNPTDQRTPYDYIILAGKPSPGLCDVMGASRNFDFTVKQQPFASGSLIRFNRKELAKFDVRLRLYPEDMDAFTAWRPLIDRAPNTRSIVKKPNSAPNEKQATALDIQHPLLAHNDIKSVVCTSVGQLEWQEQGWFTVIIKFLEYRPIEVNTQAGVDGSDGAPKPQTAAEREIQALADEAAAQSGAAAKKAAALFQ
jgi:hypothetical protein